MFHLYLFSFNFPFIYISKWLIQESFQNQFKIFWYGVVLKTRDLFWSYLFWGSAKWHLNLLVQNVLNWWVNWFLNLLVGNVIEMEIKREKVQMKPPIECALNLKTQGIISYNKGFSRSTRRLWTGLKSIIFVLMCMCMEITGITKCLGWRKLTQRVEKPM